MTSQEQETGRLEDGAVYNEEISVNITPEMVEAGVDEFDAWEPDHVFDEQP